VYELCGTEKRPKSAKTSENRAYLPQVITNNGLITVWLSTRFDAAANALRAILALQKATSRTTHNFRHRADRQAVLPPIVSLGRASQDGFKCLRINRRIKRASVDRAGRR
jgi:hypothetical protein